MKPRLKIYKGVNHYVTMGQKRGNYVSGNFTKDLKIKRFSIITLY